MTRTVDCKGAKACIDLCSAENDGIHAIETAQGLGIPWHHIRRFTNKSVTYIKQEFSEIKEEI